jgi:pimeloyl-ACP methyl ester carboxylesterase
MKRLLTERALLAYALLFIGLLTACSNTTTPVTSIETKKVTPTVQATQKVETATVTVTSEPPTPTPLPTATPTPTPSPTVTPTPAPTLEYSTETVSLTTEDNLTLAGTLFLSEGDIAVVLTHMAGENDQKNWTSFAKQLAGRGFTALTFDFRCYGQSDCGGDTSGDILSRDIRAALDFLREQGFQSIVCMGASMGGRGCVSVAFDEELAGLVVVSGTGSGDPNKQDLANFVNPDMPKLFIVSEKDPTADRTLEMTRLYESAPEPKIFKTFPGSAHGTELFRTQHVKEFRETLLNFLEGIRSSR